MDLEYHGKLFFSISGKSLHILETVIDWFSKTVLFGHFCHIKVDKISFGELK